MQELSRFFRMPLEQIAFARSVLEAYEGVATLRARDADRGEIELLFPSSQAETVETLVRSLAAQVGWVEIARPEDWDR